MSANSQQKTGSGGLESGRRFVDWSQREADPQPTLHELVRQNGNPIDKADTNNATKLYERTDENRADIAKSRYDKLKCLDKYNSGIQNLEWSNSPYITYQLNRHHILALSCQLDLIQKQRRTVYHRFMQLELNKWGLNANLVAFCVCAVTVHNDETIREYHYNQSQENRDGIFVQVAQSLGLQERNIQKCYAKFENHVNSERAGNYDYLDHQKRSHDRRGI